MADERNLKDLFEQAQKGTLELAEVIGIANQLTEAGRQDLSDLLYTQWMANTTSPLVFVAYFNMGVSYSSAQKNAQAEEMYRKALEINPGLLQARINLGTCLEKQNRIDEALEQWSEALRTEGINKPDNKALLSHAYNNLGRVLEIRKKYDESLDMLTRSLEHDPTQQDVLLHLIHLRQKQCIWPLYKPIKGLSQQAMRTGTSPLAMLAISNNPEEQRAASQRFVEGKYSLVSENPLAPPQGYKHERIRIGYLSSDLSMHAVSLLTVELYEKHDRNKFEIYGFCWSHEDGTAFRQRVINGFDHFIKIGNLSDEEAAKSIREHEIDILIDLQGLTSGARPLILSYRPATVQATYLGFPGPTGLPWVDYVIADRYMIPEKEARYYSEKPLYLPNCFQVSDSQREVAPMPKRSDYGLPERAFVFCSFNNNYKYTQDMFLAWMRLLKKAPNAVLWLLADNEWSQANLSNVAKKQGIKKDRLIFAPRVVPAEYLARYQLADLFLDTFPFNGGTTANDALFMGLPILTLSGRTFASRYAGSLLTNLGLPELITTSLADYEKRAIWFARHPEELAKLKQRLLQNKASGPVFNTDLFVKDFEDVLLRMFSETKAALPQHIQETTQALPPANQEETAGVTDRSKAQRWAALEKQRTGSLLMKTRYAKIIDLRRDLQDTKYSLLEIGCGSGGIASFLERPVDGLSLGVSESGKPDNLTLHQGTVWDNNFADGQFDYVLCIDQLEHMPDEQREKAVQEMLRIAGRELILGLPCGKHAPNFESRLARRMLSDNSDIPLCLAEHIQPKLPELADILAHIRKTGMQFEIHANESLLQHYAALLLGLEFPEIEDAYQLHTIKSLYLPPIADSGWDVYYSYLFTISKLPLAVQSIPEIHAIADNAQAPLESGSALYACLHKKIDTAYLGAAVRPIHVGSLADETLPGALTDRLADGSGLMNARWCELSAVYRIWKEGPVTDVVGFCHYRRLFNVSGQPAHDVAVKLTSLPPDFSSAIDCRELMAGLTNGSIITPLQYRHQERIFNQFCHSHNTNDWLWVVNEITRNYPHLLDHALEQFSVESMYCWNMFITTWQNFDELCSLWFSILQKFDQEVPFGRSNSFQNRDVAFMAERIFDIWVKYKKANGAKINELPIYFIEFD